ncbi:hypothetical protein ACM46_15290 [Chryseobacterium angstadtii]|uniref:Uncharacterized protein n=1 Tax=Chryseobacterium angstadtii TaxID=558151 RepID=A0A0J7KW93_9FLAO|nr:hypothetical protein [Chryseobacterium angstadtii]KMQ61390.1 hypothetical protein ACM46_15290 [Chryseobacterium angstadtii]
MKARTLFFVILFSSIYGQCHTFTVRNHGKGLSQNIAKTTAKNGRGLFRTSINTLISKYSRILQNTIENNQKLIKITINAGIRKIAERKAGIPRRLYCLEFENPCSGGKEFRLSTIIGALKKHPLNNPVLNFPHELSLIKVNFYE